MPKRSEANRKTNIGIARTIPVLILALLGYAAWAITKVICIDYLLNPPISARRGPQRGSAVAILVTFYLALIALLITYGRLLDTIIRHPGLIPRGPQWYAEKVRNGKNTNKSKRPAVSRGRSGSRSEDEKSNEGDVHDPKMPKEIEYLANETLPFRVEDFWLRDVFVCGADGRPRYCSTCYNWKPDRSHHCSEMNRCIVKFDHFCPWVGGAVSETSYKFFVQFNFYAALLTMQVVISTAYFFAQRREHSNYVNGNWIALLAAGGLFLLFSGGMFLSSGQFAMINSTTIEHLDRKTKIWNLAVYTDHKVLQEIHEKGIPLQLISYPRPPEEDLNCLAQNGTGPTDQAQNEQQGSRGPTTTGHRTFAILETAPGQNPFDLGYLGNLMDIMGATIWEWLLPIKTSPCLKHDDPTSLYKLGSVVDELKANTGVTAWQSQTTHAKRRRRRRSRSSRRTGEGSSSRHKRGSSTV